MSRIRSKNIPENSFTGIILYTTPENKVKVEIFLKGENIWLTQDKIAELFGVQRPETTKHLKNIFTSGELVKDAVSSKIEITAQDGKRYKTNFHTMDDELEGLIVEEMDGFRIKAQPYILNYHLPS